MAQTTIEWTSVSWNPFGAYVYDEQTGLWRRGWFCLKVSDGCHLCYAEKMNLRLGNGLRYSKENLKAIWSGKIRMELRLSNLLYPFRLKKPAYVFTNSMTDLFGKEFGVTSDMIDRIYAVMAMTPHLTYQNLTKRPQVRRKYLSDPDTPGRIEIAIREIVTQNRPRAGVPDQALSFRWPLSNVWEGTSIENQKTADVRLKALKDTPAAIRWVSYEPALGPVDFGDHTGIDWVVIGGESGMGARPFHTEWARDTIRQVHERGAAVFVKQMGRRPVGVSRPISLSNGKGGDLEEWTGELADLRVREWPLHRA